MKRIQSIFYVATMIGGMLSVASCSNEDEVATVGKQVPLEVQVDGVQTTRSIIEGSKFVDDCQYGIFASSETTIIENGVNVCVNYSKGNSTLSKNVYLPEGVDVPVYAYYPYNANYSSTNHLKEMPIDATTQTDYLYGYSADSDNRLMYVNTEQPKANIYFKHAMARVTMRIKKSADNEKTYKFPYINLLNVDKSAYVNVLEDGAILDASGTSNLTAKPSDYTLENSDNEIVADFLVIPGNTEGKKIMLNMSDNISSFENGLSVAVPVTNWQAGQQYTYTVTIKNGSLDINQAEISEWKNSEQGGIEIGDDNYRSAKVGDIFYSDGSYSSILFSSKTPIGIVFALTDEKDGEINRTLTQSTHGRIVALQDEGTGYYSGPYWTNEETDIVALFNYESVGEGYTKVNSEGQIIEWPSNGAVSDFNGKQNTLILHQAQTDQEKEWPEAWEMCYTYATIGFETGKWYLPACGELKLIDLLEKNFNSQCYKQVGYGHGSESVRIWTSTERDKSYVWVMNSSSITYINKVKNKSFNYVRPVTTF